MKKLLAVAVVLIQVVTLVQIEGNFASAAEFSQCSDGINNDPAQDSLIDAADPGCHSDFNASHSNTYDSSLNSEINPTTSGGSGFTQCSDGINNDPAQDNLIDAADPGCHSDFNASQSSTYDPNLNSEINPTTGGGTTSYQCNDDIDNDHDGHIDMADRDCTGSTDNSEFSACGSNGCNPPPPTNRAPVCPVFTGQHPNYTVSVGSHFVYDVDATDPDGDSISYALTEAPSGMNINASTGLITWEPSSSQAGNTYDVTVRARDSRSASCNSSFTIRVRVPENPCSGSSCTPPPPVVYQCSDNIDNDGDGHTDHPSDPGCYGPTDNDEYNSAGTLGGNTNTNTNSNSSTNVNNNTNINNITIGGNTGLSGGSSGSPQCDDNRDNDGDGDYDYPEDAGCSSRSDNTENSDRNDTDDRQCDDNRDNDGDGDYDYPEDRGCSSRTDNSENSDDNDNDENQCNDDRDNDNDGDIDYPEDAGCSSRTDDSERSGSGSGNSADGPYFISSPSNTAVAGQTYSYNADAISPDDRDLDYDLAVNPSGMTINSSTGFVQWFVPTSFGNTYQPVLITATDSRGDQVTQSFIISIRAQTVAAPVVSQPTSAPVRTTETVASQALRITNVDISDEGGDVIISFRTNIDARGSVRFGPNSELDQSGGFTYSASRGSNSGDPQFHEVNLGSLIPGRTHYLRAFASAGGRSAFSSEIAYVRTLSAAGGFQAETAGTDACFDGIDNDRDGAVDSADPDCLANQELGRVAGAATSASVLDGVGAFFLSPWFLLLVIAALAMYIVMDRRQMRAVVTHGPIEIKA